VRILFYAKVFICSTLLLLIPQFALASDMGNGHAALLVWLIGSGVALIISFILSCTRDELKRFDEFNLKKFILVFVAQLPIVFIAGIAAIFV
jgi:hypothetical protein